MTMKLNFKNQFGIFLVEGNTHMEVFDTVASIQEVFSESCCALCKCDNLRYVVRTVKKFRFPEIHCQNEECRARLSFGQNQAPNLGALYPIRKLTKDGKPNSKKGTFGEHRGWHIYTGDPDE